MGGWDILRETFGSKKPSEATALQIVNKFQTTGSILDEEDDDEEAEEEEECSESEQSASDDEEQSDETESDFPNKRKKSSSRTPKPKPTTSTIGIPKESSKSAFGHLVTVAEIRTDAPTAAPRQPIDCTTKNK